MPVHDWSRVDAGVFHDFHNVWISELRNALNAGLLPEGFYAMSEQHAGRYIADVLTLHNDASSTTYVAPVKGGVAVADAPPQVRRKLSLSPAARSRRKTLTVRHVTGHRIVALIEIVSPLNNDRREFVDKIEEALHHGIHLLLLDLFRPSRYDPRGMHGVVWERLGDSSYDLPADEPFTLAAYVADLELKAYVEHLAVGHLLPDMPLFLDPDTYVNVPLESTYQTTWRGTPEHWRRMLEAA